MKKIISILLVLAIVFSLSTSVFAQAVESLDDGGVSVDSGETYISVNDEYVMCGNINSDSEVEIAIIYSATPDLTYQLFYNGNANLTDTSWKGIEAWALNNIEEASVIHADAAIETVVFDPNVETYATIPTAVTNKFTSELKAIYGSTYIEKVIASTTYSGVACKITETLSYHIANASQTTLSEALSVAVTAANIVYAISAIMSGGITAALLKPLLAEICNVAVSALIPKGTTINSYFCTASFMRISYAANIMYYNYSDNITHVGVYSSSGAMEKTVHAEVCDSKYNDTSAMMLEAWYQYNRTH